MKPKNCAVCGTTFKSKCPQMKICGKSCKAVAAREAQDRFREKKQKKAREDLADGLGVGALYTLTEIVSFLNDDHGDRALYFRARELKKEGLLLPAIHTIGGHARYAVGALGLLAIYNEFLRIGMTQSPGVLSIFRTVLNAEKAGTDSILARIMHETASRGVRWTLRVDFLSEAGDAYKLTGSKAHFYSTEYPSVPAGVVSSVTVDLYSMFIPLVTYDR